ncbi:MAG: hypothetical protein K0M63_02905 [Weeksellaceae bacterium]|nr:hypothetical protein [Weeksellaceae bacterium]
MEKYYQWVISSRLLNLSLISFLAISCSSTKTSFHHTTVKNENFSLTFKEKTNELSFYRDGIPTRNGQYLKVNKFTIQIPKKVKNWYYTENSFLLEYENEQFLLIKSNFKDSDITASQWIRSIDLNMTYINTMDLVTEDFTGKEITINQNLENIIFKNNIIEIYLINFKKNNTKAFIPLIDTFTSL